MSDQRTITLKNGGKIAVPNGTLSFDGTDDSIGFLRRGDNTISLGGHLISYSDGFMQFECVTCEESFEVPEIFQASTDFNSIVYQLYIISHFKENSCSGDGDSEFGRDPAGRFGTVDWPDPYDGSTPPAGGNVHWIDDNTHTGDINISTNAIDKAARKAVRDRIEGTKRFK